MILEKNIFMVSTCRVTKSGISTKKLSYNIPRVQCKMLVFIFQMA